MRLSRSATNIQSLNRFFTLLSLSQSSLVKGFGTNRQPLAMKLSSSSTQSEAQSSNFAMASEARSLGLFQTTPLIRSTPLSTRTGANVYLKLDLLQASGSFKDRGMAHLLHTLQSSHGITAIVSSSGGNAGLAAATMAQRLGMQCTVVVPETTKAVVQEKLRSLQATVLVRGAQWKDADAVVRDMVQQDASGQTAYVPPYDHPLLWTGHSTIVDEVYDQLLEGQETDARIDAVIASVGGGGLLCGLMEGLERHQRQQDVTGGVHVVAVETNGARSFHEAWNRGELVTLDGIDTIATSLGAPTVGEATLERAQAYDTSSVAGNRVSSVVCTDAEAVDACLKFSQDHRMLVEPACGAALAALYTERLRTDILGPPPPGGKKMNVVVEVCGGSGVTLDLLLQWKGQFAL